jgi:pilus assembly protein CpaB
MNRRTRTLLVLLIAVGTAAVASYGVYRAIASIPVREVEVAHTFIAVAARPLPMGARVTAEDVRLVAWPSRHPVPGSFTTVEDVLGRGLVSAVLENEPFTARRLASKDSGAGLPPSIPSGMRAMSVKVNEVIGVAGFVVPGTRVDVLVTIRQQNDSMSRTVASNVQVLTAGTRYDQEKARDGEPIPSTVVTLMVSPDDAERITLAQAEGQIMLALRNPLDLEPTTTSGIRTAGLLGHALSAPVTPAPAPSRPRAAAPAPPPPAPVSKAYTVETIRAAKRTEEVIR